MEISNTASPLTSATQLATQDCTFVSGKCSVTFTAPSLDSSKKYSVRLSDSATTHQVSVSVKLSVTSSSGVKRSKENEVRMFLTPEGATKPGFKFYAAAGAWTANFKLSSTPAPTVAQWTFNLWSVTGNSWNSESSQTLTSGSSVSFTIGTAGYYVLTVDIQVSAIDATTRYPVTVDFEFGDRTCPSGQYFDKTSGACVLCSNIANSAATTTVSGVCDCNTGFFWNRGTSTCQACVGTCPTKPNDDNGKKDDKSKSGRNDSKSPRGQDIKQIIEDFNNGNLRKGGRNWNLLICLKLKIIICTD